MRAEDRLESAPHDAEQRGIKDGDWGRVASRLGETVLRAEITDRVAPGVVYTTFHHPVHADKPDRDRLFLLKMYIRVLISPNRRNVCRVEINPKIDVRAPSFAKVETAIWLRAIGGANTLQCCCAALKFQRRKARARKGSARATVAALLMSGSRP